MKIPQSSHVSEIFENYKKNKRKMGFLSRIGQFCLKKKNCIFTCIKPLKTFESIQL